MPGMSIHVVDVSRGVIAAGMRVDVHRANPARLVCTGLISPGGSLAEPALAGVLEPGVYEIRFHVAEFYRGAGVPLPAIPFLDILSIQIGIDDPQQHYHLPMKLTPWGLSCFRGGA
ncbi:MAG: hydroxyisourate hydrolase [Burkholderiaceae bacterium]